MQPLFQPITVRDITFHNRIVMPPMVSRLGNDAGGVTDEVVQHYAARAQAGTGYIIVEATAVDPGGRCWPLGLCLYDDHFIPGFARIAEAIHARGAVAGIQLVHGGPQASPELSGGEIVGPSALPIAEGAAVPRAMTLTEIKAIEERFADAAARAVQAGFDVVEVHGAHGYLLDSFLSTARNQRVDEYGGSIVKRMRILVETCRLVRERMAGGLLECRISMYNKRDEDFSLMDYRQLVAALDAVGIDLLHLSTDGAFKSYFDTDLPLGRLAKEVTRVPVIMAGGLANPVDANRVIADGNADFAAIGSAMFEDPAWAKSAHEVLGE